MTHQELESIIMDLDCALKTLGSADVVLNAREIRLKSLIAVARREAMELMQDEAGSSPEDPAASARALV